MSAAGSFLDPLKETFETLREKILHLNVNNSWNFTANDITLNRGNLLLSLLTPPW